MSLASIVPKCGTAARQTSGAPADAGSQQHLSILLVEDNPGDALLVRSTLARGHFAVRHVQRVAHACRELARGNFDAVLLDLNLPDAWGGETLERVLAHAARTPVIVLTGTVDDDLAVEAVRAGAQDYIVKGESDPDGIVRKVRQAIARSRLQATLDHEHQEQLSAKERLLAHVSHELRNPLHLVSLCLGSAVDSAALPSDCRVDLALAAQNLEQVTRIIGDLLDAARIDHGTLAVEVRPIDVVEVVRETVMALRRLADTRAVRVDLDCAVGLPRVLADPDRVREIVTNLGENAIKFTHRNTTIHVTVAAAVGARGFVEIRVRDEGDGISDPATAERLFARFHQDPSEQRREGLGLGLYLCRELVHRHGGSIWADNSPAGGARFTFTLPVAPRPS